MNISKINFTSQIKEIDVPVWVNRTAPEREKYRKTARIERDIYTPSKGRSRKKQRNNSSITHFSKNMAGLAILLGALGFAVPKIADTSSNDTAVKIELENNHSKEDTNNSSKIIIESVQDEDDLIIPTINYNDIIGAEIEDCINIADDEDITDVSYEKTVRPEDNIEQKASLLLEDIKTKDKDASEHLRNLRNSFNQPDIEIAKFLICLAESPDWGNNCIDPLLFYAQICQESNCESNATGDYSSKTNEFLAYGFGQFHKCAVDEVNTQIEKGIFGNRVYNNGQKYKYSDRNDPVKSLEMMILLLRYDAKCTSSTDAMLAMYNRGNKNGIKEKQGKEYVKAVYSHIGGK